MNEEEFFNKYVMRNPFDFKKSIIAHCRTLDKYDVYQWVADDEEKIKNLLKENQQLKKQIKQYTDPDDLTLMFMYCEEKAKDKIKELKEKLETSEKARKEAIDKLRKGITFCENDSQYAYKICVQAINREKEVLNILDIDKGE